MSDNATIASPVISTDDAGFPSAPNSSKPTSISFTFPPSLSQLTRSTSSKIFSGPSFSPTAHSSAKSSAAPLAVLGDFIRTTPSVLFVRPDVTTAQLCVFEANGSLLLRSTKGTAERRELVDQLNQTFATLVKTVDNHYCIEKPSAGATIW